MKHFAFKLMLFIWLILFLNNSLTAQLYINEWMPDNDNYLTDQEGEYDDWFEIYNAGTVAVNLNGYFLSDDPAEPQLFQVVQNLLVPADGFLLLWADGDLDQGDNHVDFKLSANGESIVLSDPAGNLIHQVDFGPFPTDFSSGFFSDGSANQIIFEEPTPGTANNGQAVPEPLSPPLFTIDGGFYTQTQNLTLQLPPDATQVYYTLNSSAPHPDSSDTFLYNNPITISETTVVRAVSSATGFQNSPVASEIYYFNTPYNLPTLSIIADLDDLFGPDGIHTNPFEGGSDWERFCQLELFETGGGGFAIDAGIRIQGSSSVGAPKKSFRIFFEEEYGNKFLEYPLFAGNTVEAFRNIVLRSGYDDDLTTGSGTLLRDPLASDIYEKTGGLVADRRWAILTINGEYWGIYDIRESVNEHFIESHINDNDFDMIRMTKFADDLKEGSLEDWTLLRHFLNHNDCSNPEIYAEAIRDIDVENLINFLAFVQVTAYNSWTWGTSVYKADNGGKWRFTPWDMDRSLFSREWDGFAAIEDTSGILYNNYLPKSLVRNEGFRHQFLNRTADLLNSINETNNIIADLNLIKNEISSEVPDEINRWVPDESFSEWEEEVENIEELLEGRPDTVRSNAVNAYNLSGTERLTLNVNGPGTLEVNTLLPASFPWSGIYFRDVPVRIKAVPDPGYAFAGWSDPDLPISTEIVIDVADYSDLTANFVLGNSENVNIVINEINYHSPDDADGGDWIELYNDDTVPVDLSGWTFFDASGKGFTFMDNTILPDGEYLILAADKDAFLNIYPWINNVIGNFAGINDSGFSLSNGGELLRFTNADESFTDLVDYSDDAPWPVEADGQGPSLQLNQPGLDNAVPENWTASVPTPGRINFDLLESQNIIFPSIADQPTDAAPIEITAAATSGLEVSLEILNGPATLNDNILTLTGEVGTVTIRATQAGDNEYMPAPPVTRSFEVYEKENQTISFASIADQPTDASPIEIMATASSGLAVTLEILNGPATLNNNTLTLTGEVGTVTIRATQSGDNFYNAAAPVTRSFEVYEKENQTINFPFIADQPTDASPILLMATASSGLNVEYEILSGPAMLIGNTIELAGTVGVVRIRAFQNGNINYNAAAEVIVEFNVYEKESQTINFPEIPDQPVGTTEVTLGATASSGLSVSYELVGGPAIVSGNTLLLDNVTGIVSVRAVQNGDLQYQAAPPVIRSFTIIEQLTQVIELPAIPDQLTTAPPVVLPVVASSGLPIQYEVVSGPATIENGIEVVLDGIEGVIIIRATQPGNAEFSAAMPVEVGFAVILSDQDFPAETCMVDIDPAEYPYISEVIFGTISNTSENENYSGNLDQQTILNRAATVPLTLGIEKLEDTYISVWIDYNRNGSFADEGEIVFEAVVLGNNSFQLETEITVPTDARIGATRMRLIAHRNDFASPCPASYSGEVEDYGIYLDDVTNIPVPTEILPAIRPNPFTDYVEIDWPVSGYEMSVYNSIGQRVYYRVVNGSASNIATNHWENGIYFIKLRDQQGKIITQVLIK